MQPAELQSYVRRRGYLSRVRNLEVQLKNCTFCGNERWNLELSVEHGVYHCWACRASGRIAEFSRQFLGLEIDLDVSLPQIDPHGLSALKPPTNELQDLVSAHAIKSAHSYLTNRGVGLQQIHRYQLSVDIGKRSTTYGRIMVPMREYHSGRLVCYVARGYCGEHPKYMTTGDRRIICGWRYISPQAPRPDMVVVTEGPFDGMAVNRLGYRAAVLQGTSAPGFVEWASRLPMGDRVLICLDGSAMEEAERLRWELAGIIQKVRVAQLPEESDPASMSPEELEEVLKWN